ncbi:MAG: type II toxin-antitoxin system CcdA family antitoxin [Parvibaculaceae bacterium]
MKKAANLSADADLLAEAREYGISLSQTFQEALLAKVKAERARRWQEENREAIEEYNRYIEKHGTFSEALGPWKD